MRVVGLVVLACSMSVATASAADLLPADQPVEAIVDHYVEARLASGPFRPAPPADDTTLIRRLTLDLAGRTPTAVEVHDYVESTDTDKRSKLIDRLMASPGFLRHQADAFEAMLMAGTKGELRNYLALAFKEGRPWDAIFRELMRGDESAPARKGAANFLKARAKDIDRLTSDVSSVFFGVNVSCAKCHDHPKVEDWKQDHYYGMKSFLGRTVLVGDSIGERGYGSVSFKTTDGEEKRAKFMFLTGKVVAVPGEDEPSQEVKDEEKRRFDEAKKQKAPPPPPQASAREALVEVALGADGQGFFARSIVNRLWERFFGVGLVMPLDQMHSENPPSHPELLAWLARDTAEHGYDLRRLVRGLVSSRAYARTSVWDSEEPPGPRLFAVAAVRPLTPLQLAASMHVATTDPVSLPTGEEHSRKVDEIASRGRDLASALARPGEEYQIGVSEALLMSNSERLKDLLSEGGERLVGFLLQAQGRKELIGRAVRSVLSRPPDDDEMAVLSAFLDRHEGRPTEGCRQLVWALLTGPEFRFNH